MKKFFVITQVEGFCYYEQRSNIVAIRNCTQEEIELEVNNLNDAVVKDDNENFFSFYFSEAPISGFNSEFTARFNDRDLQIVAYRSVIMKHIQQAYFKSKQPINASLTLKDVFMSMGNVMDMYFNTAITKEDVSSMYDSVIDTFIPVK